jgi:hypothetical protein
MAKQHGKETVVKLDGDDLTAYSDNSDLKFTADAHDVTTYGKDAHVFSGGLKNGTATVTGFYDTTASTGPRAVIQPLVGTVVPFIHQPEGTGSGLPQDAVDVLVTEYSQTHPVADMVKWSASLQFSDDVVSTAQSA